MGGREKQILVGLAVVMFLGTAVYLRIWAIDYSVSSADNELLRRQFDLANREAMDESAEWRFKYDEEVNKSIKCMKDLKEMKESFEEKLGKSDMGQKLNMLQKENMALLERVEALRQELESEKIKCNSH